MKQVTFKAYVLHRIPDGRIDAMTIENVAKVERGVETINGLILEVVRIYITDYTWHMLLWENVLDILLSAKN